MPSCKNGSGSYTGKEPSPKGRGYCARHEKIGTKKRGRDKKMWVVKSVKLASGKRSRRWFKVLPLAKKSKAKPTKRKQPTKKRKTKRLKGGYGINQMQDPVNHRGATLRSRLEAYMEQTSALFREKTMLEKDNGPLHEIERMKDLQEKLDEKMGEAVGFDTMRYFRKAAMELYKARRDKQHHPTVSEILDKYMGEIDKAMQKRQYA